MPQNVSGITVVSKADAAHQYEIVTKNENETLENEVQTAALEQSDENTYQDANFEDMSLEEVTEAAFGLEQELLCLKAELETLQTVIENDEEIRAMYESRLEQIKQETEELGKKLQEAETPQEKETIRKRLSSLRGDISSLHSLIREIMSSIQSNNQLKSDTMSEYTAANADYRKASLAQSTKEAEANRQMQAAQNSTSQTSFAVPASGGTTSASSGTAAADTSTAAVSSTAPKGASSGKASNNLINFLKQKEGCRLQAYQDSGGVWTIGYGHTSGVHPGQTISQSQAEQFLRQDLASFENDVSSLAQSMGVKLSQGQFDALVSFSYNCGPGNLRSSGIMQMLKANNISGAQNKMKQYIHDAAGNALQGLVTRRATEASWLAA